MIKRIIYTALIIIVTAVIALRMGWLSPKGKNVIYNIFIKIEYLLSTGKEAARKSLDELEKNPDTSSAPPREQNI